MTLKRTLISLISFMLLSLSAFAWPACSGNWVQVPTGTSSANGAIEITGDNLTFQCQTPKPPTATPIQNTNTNTNTNTNKATSSSAANAGATAGSSSTATGGNATGGSATATGGNQKQGQSQSSSNQNQSSASVEGNNSSYDNVTEIKPASASAITPTLIPTAPCLGSVGGAGQAIAGGGSFGFTRVDKGCDSRQAALLFAVSLHNPEAAARIMCSTRAAKQAKLTLGQCLATVAPTPVVINAPVVTPAPAPIAVTINVPPAPEPKLIYLETPHETVTVTAPLGNFKPAKHPVKRPTVNGRPCNVPPSLEK